MKKTISVLLALVLTVGLFSACSKDGKEETTTAAPAADSCKLLHSREKHIEYIART